MRSDFSCRARRRVLLSTLLLLAFALLLAALAGCSRDAQRDAAVEPAAPSPTALIETPGASATLPPPQTAITIESPAGIPASPTPVETVAARAVPQTSAIDPAVLHPPTPPVTQVAAAAPTATPEPLPTPPGVYSWTLKVPILMYHYISVPPQDADIYRVDLSVTPDSFREQMAFLRDNGYTTVSLYDLTLAIVNQAELPEKPVILSFDDGYLDNYEFAFPILQEFGHIGTFFVVTDFADKERAGYMNWAMLEEMAAAGMQLESHSRTHPDLRNLSRDGLIWELLGSQETIAAHIGYRPRYLAYPGGDYDEETLQVVRELDYWGAVTTNGGTWHGFNDRFEWTRVRMRNTTTIEQFRDLVDPENTIGGKPTG